MPWWGWIVLGTVILISEIIASTDFYLVFFAASAVIVGLLVLLGASLPVSAQWLIFAALSIGMLVLFRARLREKIKTREQDVDKLEDEIAVATEQLAAGATGQAELRGSTWRARNIGEVDLEVGRSMPSGASRRSSPLDPEGLVNNSREERHGNINRHRSRRRAGSRCHWEDRHRRSSAERVRRGGTSASTGRRCRRGSTFSSLS